MVFLRFDGEYSLNNEFDEMIAELSITHEPSAPYTPQQNGHSKRLGETLLMKARAL